MTRDAMPGNLAVSPAAPSASRCALDLNWTLPPDTPEHYWYGALEYSDAEGSPVAATGLRLGDGW